MGRMLSPDDDDRLAKWSGGAYTVLNRSPFTLPPGTSGSPSASHRRKSVADTNKQRWQQEREAELAATMRLDELHDQALVLTALNLSSVELGAGRPQRQTSLRRLKRQS